MDNITHTVVGLGVGELLERSLPPEADAALARTRRRLLLIACALASNFPDLDLFLSGQLPDPLGYLLNHRGHTHTLLYAVPQALALAALLWLCWPAARTLLRASAPARRGLAASVVAGLGLHLLLDYTNSYGLHPFYPFDGRWFYGDMVFIVEPLYWIAFGAPLAMMLATRRARMAALAVPVCALLFFTAQGYLGVASCAALLGTGALLGGGAAAGRRAWPCRAAAGAGPVRCVCDGAGCGLARGRPAHPRRAATDRPGRACAGRGDDGLSVAALVLEFRVGGKR